MELPQEIFEEMAAGAHFETESTFAEARKASRVRISMEVLLVRLGSSRDPKPMPAKLRDLSSRGVGLEFSEALHVEEAFAIRVIRRDGSPLWIYCQAVRWSPMRDKLFSIGAKFTRLLHPPKHDEKAPPTAAAAY